jgi:hypothetical protein
MPGLRSCGAVAYAVDAMTGGLGRYPDVALRGGRKARQATSALWSSEWHLWDSRIAADHSVTSRS